MILSQAVLFDAAVVAYFLGFLAYLLRLVLRRASFGALATASTALGFGVQSVGLLLRGLALGAFPVTDTYESLVFYAWVFALGYLTVELVTRREGRLPHAVGMLVTFFACVALGLASSPLYSPAAQPLVPALRSHWLALHVSFTFLGEGFLAVAFASSVLYLLREKRLRRQGRTDDAALERLDEASYRAVAIGFPLFTLGGLVFGAIWAKHVWGRYWGWDPKETFMLVTWLVYVLYLHVRLRRGWRNRRTAWIAVVGFLLALFTFAGVNYLLRGLHSYR
ncbi:MAG: c-type cytochrome biogenesis protein CcsB [Candidatus Bipolaricaulis sp.]|nr:c-type cytochrome biogenesis protein CcsB [Candidatus Bipolaricaulis sp.]